MSHRNKKGLGATIHEDGVEFRVWAPFAQAVTVFVGEPFFDDKETVLQRDDNGEWFGFVEGAKPGQEYRYHLQTADGTWIDRNDPYARQLTVSDNGKSIIHDPSFDWEHVSQPSFSKDEQIIYELHVGTFHRPDAATTGTFQTAIEKLDYLKDLGITTIELMPITAISNSHGWGYAPTHLFAIEATYGGRHGLLSFVKAAHERGLAVIVDVVYNHFVGDNMWQFDGWSENGRGGIYFYNDERGDTPWGARPDYGRPEVRQFILDNVTMWLTEYQLDGIRVDSTIYMRNTEGHNDDPAHDIADAWSLLQDINHLAHRINPQVTMIAEDSSANEYITKAISEGGAGFDAQWSTTFPLAIRARFAMDAYNYHGGVEDELRKTYNGRSFDKVIFGDSHDTAGNGSARLNESTTPGNAESVFARQRVLIANALTLTAPGIPMLLQGEEFMQEGNFNDWQMLEWDKTERFAGIVQAHRDLMRLRRNVEGSTAGLSSESINVFHNDSDNNILAYHRWQNGGVDDDTIVVVNFSDVRHEYYEITAPIDGDWVVRFNSSWSGYSPDFNETPITTIGSSEQRRLGFPLADYNVVILSRVR